MTHDQNMMIQKVALALYTNGFSGKDKSWQQNLEEAHAMIKILQPIFEESFKKKQLDTD